MRHFSAAQRAALRENLQHSEGASPDAPRCGGSGEPLSERTFNIWRARLLTRRDVVAQRAALRRGALREAPSDRTSLFNTKPMAAQLTVTKNSELLSERQRLPPSWRARKALSAAVGHLRGLAKSPAAHRNAADNTQEPSWVHPLGLPNFARSSSATFSSSLANSGAMSRNGCPGGSALGCHCGAPLAGR